VDPALHPQELSQFVSGFTERVPGVLHTVVVAADGVPVAASDRIAPEHLEQLSAITSGLTSLACASARMFDGEAVTQALVTMELATLVVMAIDDGSSLAVLTTATADLDLVAYEMTMLVERAGGIFSPPIRAVRTA
jgi:predicted regulator of Ras-like GTPase activity (Roadblock/LC7/MglB family)